MLFLRPVMIGLFCLALTACSDESPAPQASPPTPQAPAPVETSQQPVPGQVVATGQSTGGVTVQILPERPSSTVCLWALIQGTPGRNAVIWKVNNEVVLSGTETQLCNGSYKRGDHVSVEVGTQDKGAQATVTIENSPPRVVDISSTPAEIFAGTDISVTPVAEDADGDTVDFTYQWLINGNADPLLTQSTLPGNRFKKGDTVQVLIVPNDFYADGPTYASYAQPIPNAGPRIISQPPQGITSLDYRYQVEVSDPDDQQFTYRLAEAPAGMSIDAAGGLITWSLAGVVPGTYNVAIIVADPDGAEAAQEYMLTLGAPQQN